MRLFRAATSIPHRQLSHALSHDVKNFAAVLKVITWPPSRKELDDQGRVVNSTPLTSIQAKSLLLEPLSKNDRIEPYGHAAAELRIDFKNSKLCPDIMKRVQELTKLNDQQFMHISSLHAYISWHPKLDIGGLVQTGGGIESSQDDDINKVKDRILSFLGKKFHALGSDYVTDVSQFGDPASNRIATLTELDFVNVIEAAFRMMRHRITPQKIITMEEVLPEAAYHSVHLLLQHAPWFNTRPFNALFPGYACTTAVLRLLKAGVGIDKYCDILNNTASTHPELSQGFPMVEITNAITHEIYKQESVKSFKLMI